MTAKIVKIRQVLPKKETISKCIPCVLMLPPNKKILKKYIIL